MKFDCTKDIPVEGMFTFRPMEALTAENIKEVVDWCQDRFGPPGVKNPWDHARNGVVYIDNDLFAFEFKMRWC